MNDTPQPLTDHLEELRSRLIWSLLTLAAASVGGYFLVDTFIGFMGKHVGTLVFLKPTEAFTAKIKMAVILGVFLAAPVFIYHIWRFVGVALTVSERRVILGAMPFSYALFLAGASFAWFVIVPVGLKFLLSFGSDLIQPTISVSACLDFAAWVTLGLGFLFQMPVVLGALARWGIVTAQQLSAYRRHAVLAILVCAAFFTPGPDVLSQLMLAGPSYLLFELSVVLAKILQPKTSS